MLRSIDEILGYTIQATDGDIGRCQDFLFDDRSWVVRYMVARTAKWLPGREVLVSPVFLQEPDWSSRQFPVTLTREQLEQAPPLEEHAPVSRQYEIDYHEYFALPFYWIGNDLWGTYPDPAGVIHPVERISPAASDTQPAEEGHLRSTAEVTGYHIATTSGDLGHVDDFLVDDTTWALRYLVVDTRNWLPGRKVLVSPRWIDSIHWANEKVYVNLDSETIKDSPAFDPSQPVNRRYEVELYDYYGRPHDWK